MTHRGCPFQCVFCGHNSGFKPRYRTPATCSTRWRRSWRATGRRPDRRRDVRTAHGEDEEDPRGDHRPGIAAAGEVLGATAGRPGGRGVHAAPEDCELRGARARSRVGEPGGAARDAEGDHARAGRAGSRAGEGERPSGVEQVHPRPPPRDAEDLRARWCLARSTRTSSRSRS